MPKRSKQVCFSPAARQNGPLHLHSFKSWLSDSCKHRSAGVVVITFVSHTKGARFDPWVDHLLQMQNLVYVLSFFLPLSSFPNLFAPVISLFLSHHLPNLASIHARVLKSRMPQLSHQDEIRYLRKRCRPTRHHHFGPAAHIFDIFWHW